MIMMLEVCLDDGEYLQMALASDLAYGRNRTIRSPEAAEMIRSHRAWYSGMMSKIGGGYLGNVDQERFLGSETRDMLKSGS